MKIEIVEFYLDRISEDKKKFFGTLHIYITDYRMDLRGITVKKINNRWWFNLPHKKSVDSEKDILVNYPIINFTDNGKNQDLMKLICSQGKEYIENNNPEIFEQRDRRDVASRRSKENLENIKTRRKSPATGK